MNEYMDCYFTGVTLGYQPTPSQELRLQVTDNRIGSMEAPTEYFPPESESHALRFSTHLTGTAVIWTRF